MQKRCDVKDEQICAFGQLAFGSFKPEDFDMCDDLSNDDQYDMMWEANSPQVGSTTNTTWGELFIKASDDHVDKKSTLVPSTVPNSTMVLPISPLSSFTIMINA
ncbi:hypothetical protein R1flu_016025 [Riccia fluitans]|uniref:Uncharacterized protein n=1 Tax=Riccia fluitans TaxID=41844 RepID=A0ABD1YKM7_9MARC